MAKKYCRKFKLCEYGARTSQTTDRQQTDLRWQRFERNVGLVIFV